MPAIAHHPSPTLRDRDLVRRAYREVHCHRRRLSHDSQGEGYPFDQVLPTTTEILPFLSDFLKNRSEPRALSRLHGAPDIIASYLDQLPAIGLREHPRPVGSRPAGS